jgi:hypothetical protein
MSDELEISLQALQCKDRVEIVYIEQSEEDDDYDDDEDEYEDA